MGYNSSIPQHERQGPVRGGKCGLPQAKTQPSATATSCQCPHHCMIQSCKLTEGTVDQTHLTRAQHSHLQTHHHPHQCLSFFRRTHTKCYVNRAGRIHTLLITINVSFATVALNMLVNNCDSITLLKM